MQKWRQWESAPDSDWGTALQREAVIRPLAEEWKLGRAAVQEASQHLGVSRALVYRLIARYRQRAQTSSLWPWKRGPARNTRYLEISREDLLTACIKEFYLAPERPSLAALFQQVRRRFAERQLPVPNYRTMIRRVAGLDPRYAMAKRQGSKPAQEKFGPVGVSTLQAEFPMDVVPIDHTLADVIVVDRACRQWIGRPWLTLAVDVASRAVVGFRVSLENPSALSVSLVLTHAVLHSAALLRGCQEYGVALQHRPRRQPHLGGHSERLVGTMRGAVHLLPGTTFSNGNEKGLTILKGVPF